MPEEEPKQHKNRPFSVPRGKNKTAFSRSDILTGKTPAAFGSTQSAQVAATGEDPNDPTTFPHKWPGQGKTLRMPKTVILSSCPFWTLYWPSAYMYFPRDVIGDSGLGFLNNYYYFDMWNGLDLASTDGAPSYDWIFDSPFDLGDPGAPFNTDPAYLDNPVWENFNFLTDVDKQTVNNSRIACTMTEGPGCDQIPSYLFQNCLTPPTEERFFKAVLKLENPYYEIHPQLLEAFKQAKEILENDPVDPIYVVIPNWVPAELHQIRNAFLKQNHEMRNAAHGGGINGNPCHVSDTVPCFTSAQVCWAPPYPSIDDPRNQMGFTGPSVPWLMSADPGVGTDTLHIYIGHPVMAYTQPTSMFDYQAWPLTPEVQFIGPVQLGTYTGAALPFFAGRRAIWRVEGFDLGYMNHGAKGLYDNLYHGIVEGAADTYKNNFFEFRDLGTRIFTYDPQWGFGWGVQEIQKDRIAACPASAFYFGFTFELFAALFHSPPDGGITDCSAQFGGLRFAETNDYFPSQASIDQAIGVGQALAQRVEEYYRGNDPGAAEFFQLALDRNGLEDFNVKFEGPMPGSFLTADGIVEYVRSYFKDHP